jgi:hypothetical protein
LTSGRKRQARGLPPSRRFQFSAKSFPSLPLACASQDMNFGPGSLSLANPAKSPYHGDKASRKLGPDTSGFSAS